MSAPQDNAHREATPGREASARGAALEAALKELAEAVASRKAEQICAAYMALRRASAGRDAHELLRRADADAGVAADVVLSAFSHRRCFMCEDGVSPCRSCEGTGLGGAGAACPDCAGLGLEACPFCQGTAWNDGEQVPAEIRLGVLRRRLKHVGQDGRRLAELPAPDRLPPGGSLPDEKRRQVAAWLFRLRERLRYLASSELSSADGMGVRLRAAADHVDRYLRTCRRGGGPSSTGRNRP